MAFDFPNTPNVGDLYTDATSGAVYRWNGTVWLGGGPPGPIGFMPLQGVTDGSNAPAGQVGEVISSVVPSPGVAIATTQVGVNVTSINLTAGDWDVCGEVWVALGTGGGTNIYAGISLTSATLPAAPALNNARTAIMASLTASTTPELALRTCRISVTATTTVYLIAQLGFPSGAPTAYGMIWARRAR
jgi:hypothetical protein